MRVSVLIVATCCAALSAGPPFDKLSSAKKAFEQQTGERIFDSLVEYPCEFTIKVIGQGDIAADVVNKIGRVTATDPSLIKFKTNPSSRGTYVSVSVDAPVANADELYECYAALRGDPRIKFTI